MVRYLLVLIGSLGLLSAKASIVQDTLYINQGLFTMVDTTTMPSYAFNSSTVYNQLNTRIILSVGDTLQLTVINTDSNEHGFDIKGIGGVLWTIAPTDSVQIESYFSEPGVFIYYDPTLDGDYRYMGLGGMIVVLDPNSSAQNFYWNLKEHQPSYNEDIYNGLTVDWNAYYPSYFTLNGKSNPFINEDAAARVVGNVGDTLHVYMVNTGNSIHSIHYHGYHANIIRSTKFPFHVGRSKDTFAIHSMEAVVVELVPHQPGEYPVHDHNLVAVSGGNIYPNGMFLTILIE